jgi:RNA polymerase sigma-70 factor (ECF subfamily)
VSLLARSAVEEVFKAHERFLWGLCYRLTGSAADSDDLVQETFIRAMEHPPANTDDPWRPWLVRVATNLGLDLLRRRRRRGYVGPWLPAAIDTGEQASPDASEPLIGAAVDASGRYDMLESVSFAFLLALEALTPRQRAVLLLRDVFDYSVSETATALDLSEANVKTTHHRARRAMRSYDRERCVPTRALQERTRDAIGRFIASLASQDTKAIEDLLAADVRALSDGGGEFFAARKPVLGRTRVGRFYLKVTQTRGLDSVFTVRMLNGLPAVVVEFADAGPRQAKLMVLRCEVGGDGRIHELHSVLARRKLTAVAPPAQRARP